jgi:hypothetical protein
MEAHPRKVIAERAGVHAAIEALDPSTHLLIVVNLMFCSASFSLCEPELKEALFVKNVAASLRPLPEGYAAGAVNGTETAQLAELLRELRDFR